jgi:DnaJ-class molecular chaperone
MKQMSGKICDACGGAGQLGSFLGVSRFLLTWDECPFCAGTGIEIGNGQQESKAPPSRPEDCPDRPRKKRGLGRK